ncbi:hypothetical protein BO70DRAFT_432002 [Aspergillus heteromorphus CBS 117.55]|uniref:Uncharacterized protein n=1 Tax=Aspergillus heteromorphus CBS 117.55 TaxID=1448321 RepID=A0A317VA06_9EURO|nr:uncharacterized protein BO70DRAFT_432002 [Aspergillus heteromorphus CBS 117.55]PWY70905.1 hypothetical protein BO70DRAFT_432002 [Aspergillus heteromorphus CBS 117.55]
MNPAGNPPANPAANPPANPPANPIHFAPAPFNPNPQVLVGAPKAAPAAGPAGPKMKINQPVNIRNDSVYKYPYWEERRRGRKRIFLTHRALVEFRVRESDLHAIFRQPDYQAPRPETKCKTVEAFARCGGPDMSGFINYNRDPKHQSYSPTELYNSTSKYEMNAVQHMRSNGMSWPRPGDYNLRQPPSNIDYLINTVLPAPRTDMRNLGAQRQWWFGDAIANQLSDGRSTTFYEMLLGTNQVEALPWTRTMFCQEYTGLLGLPPHMAVARPHFADGSAGCRLRVAARNELRRRIRPRGDGGGPAAAPMNLPGAAPAFPPPHAPAVAPHPPPPGGGPAFGVLHPMNQLVAPRVNPPDFVVPNFFASLKIFDNQEDVGRQQLTHFGAIGARAIRALQYHHRNEAYDGCAYSFGLLVVHDEISLYAIHARDLQNGIPGRSTGYVMTELYKFCYSNYNDAGNAEFQDGIRAVRNLRDYARDCREYFLHQAEGQH